MLKKFEEKAAAHGSQPLLIGKESKKYYQVPMESPLELF